MLARAIDAEWRRLGTPDPFVVIEGGAGRGALAKAILDAAPACTPALRYVLVERSAALRADADALLPVEPAENIFGAVVGGDLDEERVVPGTGPVVAVLDDLPREPVVGMIIGNELLDNLPFRLFERHGGGWREILVAVEGDRLRELPIGAQPDDADECERVAPGAEEGARIPLQHEACAWVVRAHESIRRGRIVLVDYASDTPTMARRPWTDWVRTYRGHARGGGPLDAPGEQDVTCEVAVDQLRPPHADRSQAEWLRVNGIDELAEAARAAWRARAHIGDLEAIKARSRAGEADAITDPGGLGAFRVLEWQVD